MKFGLIHTTIMRQVASLADLPDLPSAMARVGLTPGAVDHGTVARFGMAGIAIVVGEYALFDPPSQQRYFTIDGYNHLCVGPAVLYCFDQTGETIDLAVLPPITWLPDQRAVERAIAEGSIKRPHIGMGDDVIWRWPGPRPSEAEFDRLMRKVSASDVLTIDDTMILRIDTCRK